MQLFLSSYQKSVVVCLLLNRILITFEKKVINLYRRLQDRVRTKLYPLKEPKLEILGVYISFSF